MKEHEKIKAEQAKQLGSVDGLHPMKQVTIMSAVQIVMLLGMGAVMFLIGISV